MLREEKKLWKKGYKRVAGLDEAGIGPLAGPVVAAAVIVKKFSIFNFQFSKIRDSKKLSSKQREEFYKILTTHPNIYWGVGIVSPKVIDKINILNASRLAMKKSLVNLEKKPRTFHPAIFAKGCRASKKVRYKIDFIILDGKGKLDVPIPQKAIVKADEKVFSCTAASIIAKVTRDRIMMRLHKKYPQYRFDLHKGYPTKLHIKMLKKYGPCPIHRKSFKPTQLGILKRPAPNSRP